MISQWRPRDRWWDAKRFANRVYWRVMTVDFQVFELYGENGACGVLDDRQARCATPRHHAPT